MCKRLFVLFCLVILIVACIPAKNADKVETPEMTDAQRHEISDTIKQTFQGYINYDWKNDPDWYSKFFVEDNDVAWMGNPGIFVHGIKILPNREAQEAVFMPMAESRTSTNITVLTDYVSVISDTVAVYTLEGKYSITNLEGETGPEYPVSVSVVFLKKNGGWKILHYHQSWSNTPIETEKEETEK